MGVKERKIVELQEQVFHMREQLIAANMDSDKASVSALAQVYFPLSPINNDNNIYILIFL